MPAVVMFADTVRSPELRHEVPLPIGDPLVYVETNGSRYAFAGSLELPRLAEIEGLHSHGLEDIGWDELVAAGMTWHEAHPELVLRACRRVGVESAVVPRSFPLEIGDHLRANGVEVRPDGGLFDRRRRAKNDEEVAGIRRAAEGCGRAMELVRERLGSGRRVTCEDLQEEISLLFAKAGLAAPEGLIVSHGPQTAIGHEEGSGAIEAGEPVVVDVYPVDVESGCFADMTRTFCIGEPPEELLEFHRLCRESLERALAAVRAGARATDVYARSAEVFEEAGQPTQRTKEPGTVLDRGYFHSLGHGVGLEVHERPLLGRAGTEELVERDVITLEPGCYLPGFGGCRLEDLVVVTDEGYELLTSFPYDLEV